MPTTSHQGSTLHYTIDGEGPPVVLLHSFLCSGEMWRAQVPALSEHHRVINLDLRGHGRSGKVLDEVSLEDLAADTLAVLDHEQIESAAWAGLSIGGMISLRAALEYPSRVNSLLLFDTDAGAESRLQRLEYWAMGLVARTIGLRPLLGSVSKKMFGRTSLDTRKDLVNEWRERFSQIHLPSVLQILQALNGRRDLLPDLGKINTPTLVVVGSEDRSLPPERSQRIAEGISHSRYLEIPKAGHLSALEQPELANRAMLEHLAR